MKRILVTGATGYLGSYFLKRLAKEKDLEILAIVREGTEINHIRNEKIGFLRCNLTDYDCLRDALNGIKELDIVYHLAAGVSGSYYELMMNSVVATDNLFKALGNCTIKRFVLVSSFSVYKGAKLSRWSTLDENSPIETDLILRDSYTAAKAKQERLVREYCDKLRIPLAIIRPGKIYGPRTDLLPPQLGIRIPGVCFILMGGNHIIPLTHVENCADAVFLAGIFDGLEEVCTFNIIDDKLPSQRQFIRLYKQHLGRIPRLIWVPDFVWKGMAFIFEMVSKMSKGNIPPVITRYRSDNMWKPLRYDNSLAKQKLGWVPSIPVESGLKSTFNSAKNEQ